MKLSIKYLVLAALISGIAGYALFSDNAVHANVTGAPVSRTGSPGDGNNCSECHTGSSVTSLAGLITSNIPVEGYDPGHVYSITAMVVSASNSRFGFEISPQNSSGTRLGTMTITDATRTQLIGSGKYITHKTAGTTGSGSNTWSFNWTAPAMGTGTVTFYGAFNFTNNNNSSSGDVIRLSQLVVPENLTASVDFISETDQIKVWPNPVADVAHFSIPKDNVNSSIRIFNSAGSLVREMNSTSADVEMDLSDLPHGIYYTALNTAKGSYSHKLIKQ